MSDIAMKTDSYTSGWMLVLGHGCCDLWDMEQYVATLGSDFKIVRDDFEPGDYIPKEERRKANYNKEWNPEMVQAIVGALEAPTK